MFYEPGIWVTIILICDSGLGLCLGACCERRGEMQSENIENTNKLFSSSAHLPSPGGRQWIQLKGGKGQIEKLCKTFKLKIFRAWVLLQNIILVIGELQEVFCIICQNKWFYFCKKIFWKYDITLSNLKDLIIFSAQIKLSLFAESLSHFSTSNQTSD